MALSKEEILDAIAEMSVIDIVDLIEAMEEKFGVSAAAPVAAELQPQLVVMQVEKRKQMMLLLIFTYPKSVIRK